MERARAEGFVRDLFRFVLDRRSVLEKDVGNWTDHLLATGDPIAVFESFARSDENRARLHGLEDGRTEYPPGHFYSPVVSRSDIAADRARIFGPRALLGVDLNDEVQQRTFAALSAHVGSMPFGEEAGQGRRYHYRNTSFGFGDAAVYWGMLNDLRPRRLIEIGSGYTSALALDAIEVLGLDTRCTFVDPHPELALRVAAPIGSPHEMIRQPVQRMDPALVGELGANDILFIDSSHVAKTGSDVHFEITELLPRLSPGAIVHFHDVFYPFEYPEAWTREDNKSWNELYLIHAWLMFNEAFEVIYFNHYFCAIHPDLVERLEGKIARRMLLNPGGGLWLRRR